MTIGTWREPAHAATDFDRVGGAPAVEAVVDRFAALVMADAQLARYLAEGDLPGLKRHQVLLMAQVLGGSPDADGQEQLARLDLDAEHGDLVASYLVQALIEAGVPGDVIGRVGRRLGESMSDVVVVR